MTAAPAAHASGPAAGAPALEGVRILALEQAIAGPFATHILADMGAEVIKVERPGGGDVVRGWDRVVRGLSSGYVAFNRRKRSVVIDGRAPGGREVLDRLVGRADVFFTNFAPGVPERFGLGYDALASRYPRLIYASLSGYGREGPYKDALAYDLLIQGEAGMMAMTGYPEAPAKVGAPIGDLAAGMYAALGIVLALYQRERTGVGQLIDIAMFDATLEWLAYFPHFVWHGGAEPPRTGMRHHNIVPYGPYRARDGALVNLAVATEEHWAVFCRDVIGRPDLVDDVRCTDVPTRRANRGWLEPLIEDAFAQADAAQWLERLASAGIPHGRVRGLAEVLAHPQIAARRLIREIDSEVGTVPTVESALRMSRSPIADGALPRLGGDTAAVLRESGYSESEIGALVEEKVAWTSA